MFVLPFVILVVNSHIIPNEMMHISHSERRSSHSSKVQVQEQDVATNGFELGDDDLYLGAPDSHVQRSGTSTINDMDVVATNGLLGNVT